MKRGFTLMELLAVVVILGLVAVFTVPSIINSLKNKADKEYQSFQKTIALATENYYQKNTSICDNLAIDNPCYITVGDLFKEGLLKETLVNPKTNESIVSSDKIEINKQEYGNLEYTFISMNICDDKMCLKGTVYYNPETSQFCSKSDYKANTIASNVGNTTGCMKWYTYKNNGNGTYQLILDHNTTATVAWNSSGSNTSMNEVATSLKNDTSSWDNSLKARLITAKEIAEITGNTTFSEATSNNYFYFDSLTTIASTTCTSGNTSECKYGWLYDRTATNCTLYGCLNDSDSLMTGLGYWTVTPSPNNVSYVWYIYRDGRLAGNRVDNTISGVRPVITVSYK